MKKALCGNDGLVRATEIKTNSGVTKCSIHICYLPGGRSIWEKTVPEVLSTAQGRRPSAALKTKSYFMLAVFISLIKFSKIVFAV